MKSFNKPAKTFAEQIELLKARGMQFANEQQAQFYLEQINYYRLGAYWLPFEHTHSPHCFKPDTSFEQVLELYVFDRELRLLILDAIERLEVAVRTRFAYELAHRHGCHAYLQEQYFKPAFRWHKLLESLEGEVDRADEVFIEHYKRTYDDPELPPIWATCEVMSFGQLSKWYQLLAPIQTRKAISSHFDCDEKQFEGLLQHFVYLRIPVPIIQDYGTANLPKPLPSRAVSRWGFGCNAILKIPTQQIEKFITVWYFYSISWIKSPRSIHGVNDWLSFWSRIQTSQKHGWASLKTGKVIQFGK